MKKIFLLVLCLSLLFTGCTKPETNNAASPQVSATVISQQITGKNGTVVLELAYPQLTVTLPDSDIARNIQDHLNNLVQQRMVFAFELEKFAKEAYLEQADWSCWSATIQENATRVDAQIISIYFQYQEFSGGVHPNFSIFSANYHSQTGHPLMLTDLIAEGHSASELAGLVNSALQADKALLYDDYEALVSKAFCDDTFPCWYLTKDGLCFTFAPYAIGPYASGIITATVSYENLGKILRPEYL